MKIFCASIDHETNKLSPIPTGLDSFRQNFLYRPALGENPPLLEGILNSPNLVSICKDRGHDVSVGLIAAAHPSAPLLKTDYETLRDELIDGLVNIMPVDAVILRLHGAMVAQGYDDCEGDILARIRGHVGPSVPIAVLFDLHGNVTKAMVENTTILMACKEYPHTDFDERAAELIDLVERTAQGECKPTTKHIRVPMVGLFQTTSQPMRGFIDRVMALEVRKDILTISVTHGILWSNSPHVGAGILVTTNDDPDAASELARTLASELFAMRDDSDVNLLAVEDGFDPALASAKPVILADVTDNPGGGAASDSTFLLRALLEKDVASAAIGMVYDPVSVELCTHAGLGAKLPLRIGGKSGTASGDPVDIEATVIGLTDNLWQIAMGARDNLGPAAAVRFQDVDIILSSTRQQVLSPECFTNLGVNLDEKKLIVVKSAQHFQATFVDLNRPILFIDAPGTLSYNSAVLRLTDLARPLWPFDAPPFTAHEAEWK